MPLIWLSLLVLAYSQYSSWRNPIPLTNHNNDFLTISASLGSHPQAFTLLLDTEFPFLLVDSIECSDCDARVRFNAKSAVSFRYHQSMMVNRAMGDLVQEDVLFGTTKTHSAENQTLLTMHKNAERNYHGFDGLLVWTMKGLALESPHTGNINLLQNLKRRLIIDWEVFALYYNVDSFGWVPKESSSISFGSWNLSRYSSENEFRFVYADLSRGYWEVPLSSPHFGSRLLEASSRVAVLASAQNQIVMPEKAYRQIYDSICYWNTCYSAKGEVYWNCTEHPIYNDLSFFVGDRHVSLSTSEYLRKNGDWCYFRIKTIEGIDHWKLGTPFLQKFYILFDVEKHRVGLALARHDASMSTWLYWLLWTIAGVVLCIAVSSCFSNGTAHPLKRD